MRVGDFETMGPGEGKSKRQKKKLANRDLGFEIWDLIKAKKISDYRLVIGY